MTAPSLRKLAVAWKCSGCGLVFDSEDHDGSGGHARQTGPSTYEQCGPVNALCDASALPELSELLGELAVKTAALEQAEALHLEKRRAPDQCDAEFFECQICYQEGGNDLPPIPHDARVPCPFAALSSDAGRLAGELIRAARESRSLGAGTTRLIEAVDALLARFPRLREEVER